MIARVRCRWSGSGRGDCAAWKLSRVGKARALHDLDEGAGGLWNICKDLGDGRDLGINHREGVEGEPTMMRVWVWVWDLDQLGDRTSRARYERFLAAQP
jgi:hypothetical protein